MADHVMKKYKALVEKTLYISEELEIICETERQAEEWAKGVQHIHVHRLTSMWYETRPEDMKMGNVIDTTYNDGTIERKLKNGGIVFMTDEKLTGDALIDAWEKATHNVCVCGTQD